MTQSELDRIYQEIIGRRADLERQQRATRDPKELARLDRELAKVGERWILYVQQSRRTRGELWDR